MSPTSFQYGYIEEVEDLEGYKPGGYHPIHIDDRLHQRYCIVHKLGHGTFSTVWLALDEQTSKYVAIKVGIANADSREPDILSKLAMGEMSMVTPVIDRFRINGPNGTHPCFVTSPASCSLSDSKEACDWRLFQLDVARSLCAQLAMAVCFIHSKGYAHGDLHLGNLLLRLPPSLHGLSVEQLYAKFGAPRREPIFRTDGKPIPVSGVPSYAVLPAWLGISSDKVTLSDAKLLLADFGVAFRPSDKTCFASHTPLRMRAPEAIFEPTTPLSFPSDIWSLGCAVFELLGHRSLIDETFAPPDEITAQQVYLQGPMPPEWLNRWKERSIWFDDEGRPLANECDVWSWDRRFEEWLQELRRYSGMDVVGEEEKTALLDLLHWMLAWKPEERPSAGEVLDTVWMKKWALPAYEQSQKARKDDYVIHKLLCADFTNLDVTTRPTEDHMRAILFPVDQKKPKLIWLEFNRDEDWRYRIASPFLNGDNGTSSPIRYNPILKRRPSNVVYVAYRDNFLNDGSASNDSITTITATRPGSHHDWRGPIIAYGKVGSNPDTSKNCRDIDLHDFRHAADYFRSYKGHLSSPSYLVTNTRIKGVRINCNGDQKVLNKPHFEEIEVSLMDIMFGDRDTSDIAKLIGLPILTKRCSPDPSWANQGDMVYENTDAMYLHLCCDPNAEIDPNLGVLGWGCASTQWQRRVGSIIVVRQDKKPLSRWHVEALCRYCRYEAWAYMTHSRGSYSSDEPMSKDKALSMICRPTFSISWERMLREKAEKGEVVGATSPYLV
ncbi:hypothetical protein GQX73_g5216 [Xylaria multiplex]|uniref:Protein kinase domain-containing protein n=1 Tax=Xylaria multiplex TaxID=323545 RepID=A0A7C8J134_9PEZI|nr:hypothetical protein GQX73_g5216 [Xylaria multiplex]